MNHLKWKYTYNQISEQNVITIVSRVNFKVPESYIKCAAQNNGGHVEPKLFRVDGKDKVFGSLLSYDESDMEYILKVYEDYKDTLPKKILPFAFDPTGNLICFDYKNLDTDPIVVFWEHEGAAEKSVLINNGGMTEEAAERKARENIYYVADSFTDFLNQLYDSEE